MAYKDKNDQKLFVKKHYEENKDLYKQRAKAHNIVARKRNREYVNEYLRNNPCVDCGESDIIVLDFDHLQDKEQNISTAINKPWSLKKLKEEIAKCEIRCANCHRRMTYKRRIAGSTGDGASGAS